MFTRQKFEIDPFSHLSGPEAPTVEPLPETIPEKPQEDTPQRRPVEPAPFHDPAEQPGPCGPDPSTCPMP